MQCTQGPAHRPWLPCVCHAWFRCCLQTFPPLVAGCLLMVWAFTSYQASLSVGAGTSTLKTTTSVSKCAPATAACITSPALPAAWQHTPVTAAVWDGAHHVQSTKFIVMNSAVRC